MVSRLTWQRNKIYTIGLSTHTPDAFFNLLLPHGITLLADVRTPGASRPARTVDRSPLAEQTLGRGLRYLNLSHQLGGCPADERFYDDAGFVCYDRVAQSPEFLAGIKRLERESRERPLVLVGGEEDPAQCHRRRLVGRVLQDRGAEVVHLRGDGRIQSDAEVAAEEAARNRTAQRMLFPSDEANSWKSLRSVSRQRRPPTLERMMQ